MVELPRSGTVLEIGSGTGQHAVDFAAMLPALCWQTSDVEENHAGINSWIDSRGLANLVRPIPLDVSCAEVEAAEYDAVYSANTAHIMSIAEVRKMFALAAGTLVAGGVFCLYGPFRSKGQFNAPSNAAFHNSLQSRNSDMGIRDIEELDGFGAKNGLELLRQYAMPANNQLMVWQKGTI